MFFRRGKTAVTANPWRAKRAGPRTVAALAVCAALTTAASAQHCRSEWTAAYKCMNGCGCPGGGNVAPVAPPAPVIPPAPVAPPDPFPEDARTYDDLVRRIGVTAQVGAPSSGAALSLLLDRLGADMAGQIDATFGALSGSVSERDSYRWTIANLPAQIDALQQSIASLQARQAGAEAGAEQRRSELQRTDRRATAFSQMASDYSADTVDLRKSIVAWLFVTVPADVRSVEPDAWQRAQDIPAPAIRISPEPAAALPAQGVVRGPEAHGVPHYTGALPAVTGANAQKLAAIDTMATVLEDLRFKARTAAQDARALRDQAEALIRQKGIREGTLRAADQAVSAADKAVQAELSAARQRLDAEAGRLLARSAENFAWRMLKEHVVKPEISAFLAQNRRWYEFGHAQLDDDAVTRLVAQGKLALDLLGSRASGLDRVVGVEKKVLDAMDDWRTFVLQVPQLMSTATAGDVDAFSRDFNARGDRAMLDIAEDSAGRPFVVSMAQLRDPGLPPQIVVLGRKLKLIRED